MTSCHRASSRAGSEGQGELYERCPASAHIARYATTGHYFYVLNERNAVNLPVRARRQSQVTVCPGPVRRRYWSSSSGTTSRIFKILLG